MGLHVIQMKACGSCELLSTGSSSMFKLHIRMISFHLFVFHFIAFTSYIMAVNLLATCSNPACDKIHRLITLRFKNKNIHCFVNEQGWTESELKTNHICNYSVMCAANESPRWLSAKMDGHVNRAFFSIGVGVQSVFASVINWKNKHTKLEEYISEYRATDWKRMSALDIPVLRTDVREHDIPFNSCISFWFFFFGIAVVRWNLCHAAPWWHCHVGL